MDSCPECDAGVVYRYIRRTATHARGYAYICVRDPEHIYLERDALELIS